MSRLRPLRRTAFLAGTLLLLALLSYAGWVRLSEPRYQGKSVSCWFQEYCNLGLTNGSYWIDRHGRHIIVSNREAVDSAGAALVAMGDPAAAYLGKQISGRNNLNVPFYRRLFIRLPMSLRSILPDPFAVERRRVQAALALVPFGSKAQKEIPAVIDLLIKKPGNTSAMLLPAVPYFDAPNAEIERLIRSLVEQGRYSDVRRSLVNRHPRSSVIAQLIADMLSNGDGGDLWDLETLRQMGPAAAVAIPALLNTINSTNDEVCYRTVLALEAIGAAASNAIPALQASSTNSTSMVRSAARRAIEAITVTNSVAR